MLSFDCLGQYSSFLDSAASAIATYSDMLTYFDETEGKEIGQMWMIGWGNISHKTQNKSKYHMSVASTENVLNRFLNQ